MGAGIPDISGEFVPSQGDNGGWARFGNNSKKILSGPFYYTNTATAEVLNETGGRYAGGVLAFSAARCSSIYGSSTTVTPNSVAAGFYIKFS